MFISIIVRYNSNSSVTVLLILSIYTPHIEIRPFKS